MPKKVFPKYTGHYIDVTDIKVKLVNGKRKVFIKVTDQWNSWIPQNKWFPVIESAMIYHYYTVNIKDEYGELKEFQICVQDAGRIDMAKYDFDHACDS